MKILKKIILCFLFFMFLIHGSFSQADKIYLSATTKDPILTIYKNNVDFNDRIYFAYAVAYENIDPEEYEVELLFWDEPQAEYLKGTESYYKVKNDLITITGVNCIKYYSNGLAARMMIDDIYTRAYVKVGNKEFYSEVNKTSVVDYANRMLENESLCDENRNLLTALLNYGAAAQEKFGYFEEKLANSVFYKVDLVDGTFCDGFSYGRFQENEVVRIEASKKEGYEFEHWRDSEGNIISTDKSYELTVIKPETYTAHYKKEKCIIEEVRLTSEEAYDVTAQTLELPESINIEYEDNILNVPVSFDTASFIEKQIGIQTFMATITDNTLLEENNIQVDAIYIEINVLPYTFSLDENTDEYTLTKYYGTDENLIIPSTFKGLNITIIGNKSFKGCSTIVNVNIPESIQIIEKEAFSGCNSLYELTIPFVGKEREAVNYEAPLGYIFGYYSTTNSEYDNGVFQVYYAGEYYHYFIPSSLKVVTITDDEDIANYAFYNAYLTSITLKNTKSLGYQAFTYSSISELNIHSNLESIAKWAFYFAQVSFDYIYIPKTVKSIGENAFYYAGCSLYCEIDSMPEGWETNFNGGSKVIWNVSKIYTDNDFIYVQVGDELLISENISQSMIIEIKSEYMGLPITTITSSVFTEDTTAKNVYIPKTITKIADLAFYKTNLIIYCEYENKPENWDNQWNYAENPVVWNWKNNDIADDGNIYYCDNEIIYALNNENSTVYSAFSGIKQAYILPHIEYNDVEYSVTKIGDSAFKNCRNLDTVSIPDSITHIGRSAFYGCSRLNCVVIPNSVIYIDEYGFYRDANPSTFKIYMMHDSVPSNLPVTYKNQFSTVTVGFTNEVIEYTFETNGAEQIEGISSLYHVKLPIIERNGYIFGGWYDNAELLGEIITDEYYSPTATILYAKWVSEDDLSYFDGSSFIKAINIRTASSHNVSLKDSNYYYYKFTVLKTKTYKIYSSNAFDSWGGLYDNNQNQLISDDDDGSGYNFSMSYQLIAGQTYYLKIKTYDPTDSFTIYIS